MSKIIIPNPETKKWRQPNMGELFGELYASWNLDLLTNPGRVKINPRLYRHFDTDDDADFGKISAIARSYGSSADCWWTIAGAVLFRSANADPTSAFAQDAIANTPTDLSPLKSDMVNKEGGLYVTRNADIAKCYSGAWTISWYAGTLGQPTLSTNQYHPLEVFNRTLLIGDRERVHTVDENNIPTHVRILFSEGTKVNGIKASSDRAWIITANNRSSKGKVYEWDGYSVLPNRFYEINTNKILSIVIKENVPYILTSEGILMAHNGATFVEVARFPIYMQKIFKNGSTKTGARWENLATYQPVHQNGMRVIDGKIHISVSAGLNNSNVNLLENMMSGIWIYDENIGLYNAYSFSQYKSGDIIDFGSQAISFAGALIDMESDQKDKTLFLAGASLYTDNGSTEKDCLFKLNMVESLSRRGYFITSKIEASEIQNMWELIWVKFSQMKVATDKIVIKKRTFRDDNLPFNASVIWTATNKFTSTDANFANAAIGDEIEVIQGTGSGTTVHILTITFATPTYTITIDEVITGVTGTAKVLVSDWVKVGIFTDADLSGEEFVKLALGDEKKGSIQFKIELRGEKESPEIEGLVITSKSNIKAEQ